MTDFEYLSDLSDSALRDELAYAKERGLAELAEACELEIRSRGKRWDFSFRFFGNIYDGEPENGEDE